MKVKDKLIRWLLLLLLLGVAILSNTGRNAFSAEKDKVRVGYVGQSSNQAMIWVAKESGLLEKYGLDVTLTYLNAPIITAALISGSADMCYASFTNIPAAIAKGADLVIIAASYQGPIYSMVASRSIGKIENLRGKKIGITAIGETADFIARKVILDRGMQPDKDVAILAMGGQPAVIAALQNGAVDAGVLAEPFTSTAVTNGFPVIYDQVESGEKSVGIPLAVRRQYLKSHEELVTRFLKANLEALHLIKTDPGKTIPFVSKYLGIKDPAVLRGAIEGLARISDRDMGIPMDDLKEKLLLGARSNPAIAKLKPEDVIDTSILDKIKASGFIKELYK